MTGTQPFQIPNRRTSPVDRRQRQDRRAHVLPNQHAAEENAILHELLREAHGRPATVAAPRQQGRNSS